MARSRSPGHRGVVLPKPRRVPALLVLVCAIILVAVSGQTPTVRAQQPSASKAASGRELPLRWSTVVNGAPDFADPLFDRDGRFIIIAGRFKTEAVLLSVRTGAIRDELPATEFMPVGEPPVPIDNGVIAFRAANQRDLLLWDLNDGKLTEIPHKFTKGRSLTGFSSNGRFISFAGGDRSHRRKPRFLRSTSWIRRPANPLSHSTGSPGTRSLTSTPRARSSWMQRIASSGSGCHRANSRESGSTTGSRAD